VTFVHPATHALATHHPWSLTFSSAIVEPAPRATTPRFSFVSQPANNERQEHGEEDEVGCDLEPDDKVGPTGVADSPEYQK